MNVRRLAQRTAETSGKEDNLRYAQERVCYERRRTVEMIAQNFGW